MHGGRVVDRVWDIPERTLFVAPENGILTGITPKGTTYKTSLIVEHVKRQEYMSDESMKSHVLYEPRNGEL